MNPSSQQQVAQPRGFALPVINSQAQRPLPQAQAPRPSAAAPKGSAPLQSQTHSGLMPPFTSLDPAPPVSTSPSIVRNVPTAQYSSVKASVNSSSLASRFSSQASLQASSSSSSSLVPTSSQSGLDLSSLPQQHHQQQQQPFRPQNAPRHASYDEEEDDEGPETTSPSSKETPPPATTSLESSASVASGSAIRAIRAKASGAAAAAYPQHQQQQQQQQAGRGLERGASNSEGREGDGLFGSEGAPSSNSSFTGYGGVPRGIVGLQNLGNTCFMNSALQCFFNTPPLLQYFGANLYKENLNTNSQMGGALATSFADTFQQVLRTKEHGTVSPILLKRVVGKWAPHLSGYQQQDAQEFMRFLLDGLSEDLNFKTTKTAKPPDLTEEQLLKLGVEQQSEYWWRRHLALNDSFITETFCGQFMSKLVCCECHDVSYTFDPFFDLSVPIPSGAASRTPRSSGDKSMFAKITDFSSSLGRSRATGSRAGQSSLAAGGGADECTIEDCLRAFTTEEVIDKENQIMCSKCKARRRATKRITVHRFPKILVLHIKRFQFDTVKRSKLSTNVQYPLLGLDMSPFVSADSPPQSIAGGGGVRYDLFALTNHMGGLHGGHYTAHCRNNTTGKWHCFNDSHVSDIEADELSAEAGLPYVLFYRRVA